MKKFLKIYIYAFIFLSDFVILAQPGDDNGTGDLEGDDVPINSKIVLLAFFGVLLAFYAYKNNRKAIAK